MSKIRSYFVRVCSLCTEFAFTHVEQISTSWIIQHIKISKI